MTDDLTPAAAVAVPLDAPVRPDPERVAFEAWLNPGNHAGNVSPWVEEPGRYQQDTHQLAWLAWRAGRKQERERREKLRRLLQGAEVLFAPLCRDATAYNWQDETLAALAEGRSESAACGC